MNGRAESSSQPPGKCLGEQTPNAYETAVVGLFLGSQYASQRRKEIYRVVKTYPGFSIRAAKRTEDGFTLLELLTAFLVMGAAVTIFLQLYTASMSMAKSSRAHKVAANLAEEYMAEILVTPARYTWPKLKGGEADVGLPITLRGHAGEPVLQAQPPTALPTYKPAFNRERTLYYNFTWQAYARLPDPSAKYVEVLVVVKWLQAGREREFALTSCVPRSFTEGSA